MIVKLNRDNCLRYVLNHAGVTVTDNLLVTAAREGSLRCLRCLYNVSENWTNEMTQKLATITASRIECIDCLKFLHEEASAVVITEDIILCAVAKNNLEAVRYIHEKEEVSITARLLEVAARSVNSECLQYLCEQGKISITERLVEAAVRSESIQCLRYLHEKAGETSSSSAVFTERVAEVAARAESVECLIYLYEQTNPRVVLTERVAEAAAASDSIMCLTYLHEKAGESSSLIFTERVAEAAVSNGNGIECIIYLELTGSSPSMLTERVIEAAALSGNEKALAYLIKAGCPWNVDRMENIANVLKKRSFYDKYGTCYRIIRYHCSRRKKKESYNPGRIRFIY